MKNSIEKCTLFLLLIIPMVQAYGQYQEGQRLLVPRINLTLNNALNYGQFGYNYIGSENNDKNLSLSLAAGIEKVKSANYLQGYTYGLNYSHNSDLRRQVGTIGAIYERYRYTYNFIQINGAKNYAWLFPFGKKMGADLRVNLMAQLGAGRSTIDRDSAEVYNEEWSYSNYRNVSIQANLKLGLYYWVTKRVVLQSALTLANGNFTVFQEKVSTQTRAYQDIDFNNGLYFPFSNANSLFTQTLSISFLLNAPK